MWRNDRPSGFTQKWSGNSGSRTVMCPATPSPKPKRPKMRSAPASFCLRRSRSAATVGAGAIWSAPSTVTCLGVRGMPSIMRTGATAVGVSGVSIMGCSLVLCGGWGKG